MRRGFEVSQTSLGAALGGPVLKDKAFFFLSWEFDLTQGQVISTQVPTATMPGGRLSAVSPQLYDPNLLFCGSRKIRCPNSSFKTV
jgi:hypothetical protein